MSTCFSPAARTRFEAILTRYPRKEAALLPTLWLAQEEFGTITPEVMAYVASLLDVPPAKVLGVATFYTMFHTKPVGTYHIRVCRTLSCALAGAEKITDCLKRKLGIGPGETTPDGRFTLSEVECLASCGTGPVVQVNDTYHEGLTVEKLDELLQELPK